MKIKTVKNKNIERTKYTLPLETNHLICCVNQITGFYIKWKTCLK